MAKSIEEIVQDKLTKVSDAREVPVNFVASEKEANHVKPAYNPDDMISKLIAILVFSGVNIPITFAPPYNRVHADVEFWKRFMAASQTVSELAPEPATETQPEPAAEPQPEPPAESQPQPEAPADGTDQPQ